MSTHGDREGAAAAAGPSAALARWASRRPDEMAVRAGRSSLEFARLDRLVSAVAAAWRADAGVAPGSRVAVGIDDPVAALVALLAADRLAATTVLIDPTWPAAQRRAALAMARPDLVVDRLPGCDAGADTCLPLDHDDPEVRFLAAFTSGTTGALRAVLRSRRSWTESFAPFSTLVGLDAAPPPPPPAVLVPGPLYSTLFLFGALHALALGATIVFESVRTAQPWQLAHVVPTLLADLLDGADADARADAGADAGAGFVGRTVVCAGAALPAALYERAADRALHVVEYYGAAELSFVAAGRPGALRPFPGADVQLRGGVADRGTIWVRSPYVADGYLAGGSGPLQIDADGWATVGDLGALDADGTLLVAGRANGVISTGGVVVVPEEVETMLRTIPGVRDAVVSAMPHGRLGQVVVAMVEADPGVALSVERLRAAAASGLNAAQRPRRWRVVGRLPRTSAGKVDRAAIPVAFETGSRRG